MKIGYLFLIDDCVHQLDAWTQYFAPHQEGVDWQCYFHASTKKLVKQKFVKKRLVKRVESAWGQIYDAINVLLAKAKADGCDYYVLSSESTVPVKSFNYARTLLTKYNQSWFAYQTHLADPQSKSARGTLIMIYQRYVNMAKKFPHVVKKLDIKHWFYNETWWILKQSHVDLILNDTEVQPHFKGLHGADENYPSYLFSVHDQLDEVKNQATTSVDWSRPSKDSRGSRSPHVYATVTSSDMRRFMHPSMLFARKFAKKCDMGWLQTTWEVCDKAASITA